MSELDYNETNARSLWDMAKSSFSFFYAGSPSYSTKRHWHLTKTRDHWPSWCTMASLNCLKQSMQFVINNWLPYSFQSTWLGNQRTRRKITHLKYSLDRAPNIVHESINALLKWIAIHDCHVYQDAILINSLHVCGPTDRAPWQQHSNGFIAHSVWKCTAFQNGCFFCRFVRAAT